jgi:hypothetical protein
MASVKAGDSAEEKGVIINNSARKIFYVQTSFVEKLLLMVG